MMKLETAVVGDVRIVLVAMAYLLIKHCAADFLLQTENQRRTKGDYGALGGITHAATHILLTAPIFLFLPAIGTGAAAALLAGEFVVHYHLDWAKDQAVRHYGWTSNDTPFWWALGIDQLGHGLTYVALIWLAFSLSAGALSLPAPAL
ncbi:MAG: DUF3307 domain-containing protein [Hyphomicrobium sp.]